MNVQILVDNPKSWIIPWAHKLNDSIAGMGHVTHVIHSHKEIKQGDAIFLLSCEKILKKEHRQLHRYNLVVHESDLPLGRGWSPTTWQVLEGKKRIPIALLKAEDGVDSGDVYLKSFFDLEGHELIDEIRSKQGEMTVSLIVDFIKNAEHLKPVPQSGEPTFYPRRGPQQSALDLDKSIREQFDLLRVCDNERYPAFFEIAGKRYNLKIYKDN